jgi:hypothetical protein
VLRLARRGDDPFHRGERGCRRGGGGAFRLQQVLKKIFPISFGLFCLELSADQTSFEALQSSVFGMPCACFCTVLHSAVCLKLHIVVRDVVA